MEEQGNFVVGLVVVVGTDEELDLLVVVGIGFGLVEYFCVDLHWLDKDVLFEVLLLLPFSSLRHFLIRLSFGLLLSAFFQLS